MVGIVLVTRKIYQVSLQQVKYGFLAFIDQPRRCRLPIERGFQYVSDTETNTQGILKLQCQQCGMVFVAAAVAILAACYCCYCCCCVTVVVVAVVVVIISSRFVFTV